MVKRADLHRFVDKERVRQAIARAEGATSAPIHVSIAPHVWGDVRKAAERAFHKHIARAPARNGVLFFVVPSRREFAVIGGAGAHEALGQHAWESVAATAQAQFSAGDPTTALVLGIEEISRALAAHFPPS
jgi:uncharacterized membrane protein